MKRQRYGKVYPRPGRVFDGFENRIMQIPSTDLWMNPYSFKNSPEGSEVVPRDSGNKSHGARLTVEENSIHVVAVPLIFLGQCFGLLPVYGAFSESPEGLTFSWFSKKVVYSAVFIFLNLILTVSQVYSVVIVHGISFNSIDNIFATLLTTMQVAIYVQQARSWSGLVARWTKVEGRMGHFPPLAGLKSTVRRMVYIFCVCTLFLVVARLTTSLTVLYDCSDSLLMAAHFALLAQFNALPVPSTLAPVKTLVLAVLFLQENVVLVFDELTITVLAYALFLRFRQLNNHLQKVCRQRLSVQQWAEMRLTYNSLSELAQHLNSHLSWLILVCFGASLYDICSLLHLTLSPLNDGLAIWAILYVLVFSVLRTFTAALVASSVSEESKKPLTKMFSVPSESYSMEVCRFQMQVTHGEIVLSGLDFFSVTRSFMLTVAGTIVTYEIVLIQFGTTGGQNSTTFNNTDYCYDLMEVLDQ